MIAVSSLAVLVGCGKDEPTAADLPKVVVTYSVLGAVVSDVVGDAADVRVLMPDGIDPHDWEPSAKDIASLSSADLVVANGLDLEESLEGALEEAESAGVAVFYAGDHVSVREIGDGEVPGDHDDEDHDHGVGSDDPHLWTSPAAMSDVVAALVPALAAAGIDVGDRGDRVMSDLASLSEEIDLLLAPIPATDRKLVTGHESLGYFADQFGFTLVGAVVPSLSSQAEASAGELADLKRVIQAEGVSVIFTELGRSPAVAEAIAKEADVRLVELATHTLPADGTYRSFMLSLAGPIASELSP